MADEGRDKYIYMLKMKALTILGFK